MRNKKNVKEKKENIKENVSGRKERESEQYIKCNAIGKWKKRRKEQRQK